MKVRISIIAFCLSTMAYGQTTEITFEQFELGTDSVLNNSGDEYQFVSEDVIFPNEHFDWGTTHWSISSETDNVTPGFTNQYSSITGAGENSETYAMCNIPFSTNQAVIRFDGPLELEHMSVTNATYSYLSMLNGDDIAKKFGGESGNDPDFFDLIINGYSNGEVVDFETTVKLADFTFEDNSEDYILDDWLEVDLTGFETVDSLVLTMNSSDFGDFGLNTPQYFVVDNFTYYSTLSTEEVEQTNFTVYPNPAENVLHMSSSVEEVVVFSLEGRKVGEMDLNSSKELDVSFLPPGSYMIQFISNEFRESKHVIIN